MDKHHVSKMKEFRSVIERFFEQELASKCRALESEMNKIRDHYADWYERWPEVLKAAGLIGSPEEYRTLGVELLQMDRNDVESRRLLIETYVRSIGRAFASLGLDPHDIQDRLPALLEVNQSNWLPGLLGGTLWVEGGEVRKRAIPAEKDAP
jgi:hypothetical protein